MDKKDKDWFLNYTFLHPDIIKMAVDQGVFESLNKDIIKDGQKPIFNYYENE